jgi:hypothetical protein
MKYQKKLKSTEKLERHLSCPVTVAMDEGISKIAFDRNTDKTIIIREAIQEYLIKNVNLDNLF